MTVREEIKDINRERSKELQPGNIPQMMVMSPQRADFSKVGSEMRDIADVLNLVKDYALHRDKQQKEQETIEGAILRRQGKAYEDAQKAGKYTGDGWKVADVQIKANDFLNAEMQNIHTQFYGTSSKDYAAYLAKRSQELVNLANQTDDPVIKKHILSSTESALERLSEAQTKKSIEYNYQKTVESIPQRIASVLDSATTPEEYQAAMQEAREMLKPGRFRVAPGDLKAALEKTARDRLYAFGDETFASLVLESSSASVPNAYTSRSGKYRAEVAENATARYGDPGLASLSVKKGPDYVDSIVAASSGAPMLDEQDSADAREVFDDFGGFTESGTPARGLAGDLQRVRKQKASAGRIDLAASTGNFNILKTKAEQTKAFEVWKGWAADQANQIKALPGESEESLQTRKQNTAFQLYVTQLPKSGVIDPSIKGSFDSYLDPINVIDGDEINPQSITAITGLMTMSQNSPKNYWMQYVDGANEDFILRTFSLMEDGISAENALKRSKQIQDNVDSGAVFPQVQKKALEDSARSFVMGQGYDMVAGLTPDIFSNQSYLDNTTVVALKEDLEAGLETQAGQAYRTQLSVLAQRYTQTARDPKAALLKAERDMRNRTAVAFGVPITFDRPLHDVLKLPTQLAYKPGLYNQAVFELFQEATEGHNSTMNNVRSIGNRLVNRYRKIMGDDNRAPMFDLVDVSALGPHYRTFSGEENSIRTMMRGVAGYQSLIVNRDTGTNELKINQWNEERTAPIHLETDIRITQAQIAERMVKLEHDSVRAKAGRLRKQMQQQPRVIRGGMIIE